MKRIRDVWHSNISVNITHPYITSPLAITYVITPLVRRPQSFCHTITSMGDHDGFNPHRLLLNRE